MEICGNSSLAHNCAKDYICLELPLLANPYNNSLSFDDFGHAMLATLQLVILDEWDDIYRKVVVTAVSMYDLHAHQCDIIFMIRLY